MKTSKQPNPRIETWLETRLGLRIEPVVSTYETSHPAFTTQLQSITSRYSFPIPSVRVAINTDVDGHPESRLRDVHHPSTGLDLQLCRSEDRSLRQKPPENQAHVGYVTGLENMVLKRVFRVRVFTGFFAGIPKT